MKSRAFARIATWLLVLLPFALGESAYAEAEGLLPFNTGWEYPHFTTFRPAGGTPCDVNRPRFSWPYAPHVLTEAKDAKRHDFVLQLSATGDW